MITSVFSSEQVLNRKQLAHFAQSEAAFKAWTEEEGRTADQVHQAIVEIEAYAKDQERQLDEQLARQRDDATIAATIDMVVRQVQEKYVRESPWFPLDPPTREVNAKILWDRVLAVAQGEGTVLEPADMSDESLEAFGNEVFRLLMKAAQQLWNERRFYGIAWDQPHTHTPFNLFEPNYDHALDPANMPTPEEVEAALERGEISLDDVKAIADAQLMREAQADAESRGEVYQRQSDSEMAVSIRRPAPESSAPKDDNPGIARLMFGTNVTRRRG